MSASSSNTNDGQVAADLRAAADVLERDGWTQGRLGTADGPKCAVGSIYFVATDCRDMGDESYVKAETDRAEEAGRALSRQIGVPRDLVPEWNDAGNRTAAEVIAALRAAADRAEAQS